MAPLWSLLLLAAAFTWAVLALTHQARRAARGRSPLFARPRGGSSAGVRYMFTTAMLPSRKESVSRHPASFLAGLFLHISVFGALAGLPFLLLAPSWSGRLRIALFALAFTGAAAGGALAVRRSANRALRRLSAPDDFLASGLAVVFLASLCACCSGHASVWICAVAASALLFYLPLGKLRHMVFFFLARADVGRRLGFRGVLPPVRAEADQRDGR